MRDETKREVTVTADDVLSTRGAGVNINIWFKPKSWQSVLAAEVNAGISRGIRSAREERRINLIDCEATLEHMLLSVGARNRGRLTGMKHLVTGASARLTLRAAPDIRFNAGVSNYWQVRHGLQPPVPATTSSGPRAAAHEGPEEDHERE